MGLCEIFLSRHLDDSKIDPPSKSHGRTWIRILAGILILIAAVLHSCHHYGPEPLINLKRPRSNCPQTTTVTYPRRQPYLFDHLSRYYRTDEFLAKAVEAISEAIRIPTECYDDPGPIGEDTRWDVFGPFHDYLLGRFPRVHETLKLTKVNTYGLVYEWNGSDDGMQPILLAAHQDVVPVENNTLDKWEHPPYSGFYDGERIWGRGSSDDKGGLIAVMSAVEILIEQNFEPTRPVVLAFGFDEECSGKFGAQHIVEHLLSQYGPDSFSMVIDEGGERGFGTQFGAIVAAPSVGEKGRVDVRVAVETPGGHSSVPPAHTSIGMLAHLITAVESNVFPPSLSKASPIYDTLQCLAEHAPSSAISPKLRKAIKGNKLKKIVDLLEEESSQLLPLLKTTTAVDMISGGIKANALPEGASASVNHRISVDSSVSDIHSFYEKVFAPEADNFNLSFSAFGKDLSSKGSPTFGRLSVSEAFNTSSEPISKAPTFGTKAWDVLTGTIVTTYKAYRGELDSELSASGVAHELEDVDSKNKILVIPAMSTGNTDVRFYGELSKNIYRYIHLDFGNDTSRLNNIHTVNESIGAKAFVEMILFFTTLILNADEATTM